MKINQAGIDLIKHFEGCRLEAYKDVGGIWTVGFGHCGPDVHEGMVINQAAADQMLLKDLERFEAGVTALVTSAPNSNQFSAMVAFTYNIGLAAFKKSLLLRAVNSNQWGSAATQFMCWNHVGGKVVDGLTNRRAAEKSLFETAV